MKGHVFHVKKDDGSDGYPTDYVLSVFEESDDLEQIKHVVENSQDRIYTSWATVDAEDLAGEKIRIEEAINQQDVLLERGGPIMAEHSNKNVGRTLAYKIARHPEADAIGILHLNRIFDHNAEDDQAWDKVQSGENTGSSVGGYNEDWKFELNDEGGFTKVLTGFHQYETSTVEHPCNPWATNQAVSLVAKSASDLKKADVEKPFAGYKNFKACVAANGDKSDPEAYCAAIMSAVEKVDGKVLEAEKGESVINKASDELNKEFGGGLTMDEEVSKKFEEMTKSISDIGEAVKKLVEVPVVKQEEEDKKPEEKPKEEDEPEDAKKEISMEGKDVPEDNRPDDPNNQEVFKARFDELAKKNEELVKKHDEIMKKLEVVEKAATPRPAGQNDLKKLADDTPAKLARGEVRKTALEMTSYVREKLGVDKNGFKVR